MEQPRSPGTSPVELRNCIEELLRFTLEFSINQTLDFDLGISKDFCLELLRDDPRQPNSKGSSGVADCLVKVLSHPLYKHLASSLNELISSGPSEALCGEYDDKLKQKEWNELVLHNGAELVNILKTVNFELHVQEPYFTQLKDGLKTVEGRCAIGDYNRIQPGSMLLFNKCLVLEVQDVARYNSFSDMLTAEGLEKVLPGVTTVEEGVRVYRKFYTEEKERSNGVLAIRVATSNAQPYISLAKLLSALSYNGVQTFLGRVQTS